MVKLKKLFEATKSTPELVDSNCTIEELDQIIQAIDSSDHERLWKYQKRIKKAKLVMTIMAAENEKILETMVKSVLARARSATPKNENVAHALSFFKGASGDAEGERLFTTVSNSINNIEEFNDEDEFKEYAGPCIVKTILRWKEEETKKGLGKFLKIQYEHY